MSFSWHRLTTECKSQPQTKYTVHDFCACYTRGGALAAIAAHEVGPTAAGAFFPLRLSADIQMQSE